MFGSVWRKPTAAPGSAQRTYLIVSDIEAARDALLGAGIQVSEIFHLGPNGLASGLDPERRSYFSLASFSDPDGNSWLLQEITTRLPGHQTWNAYGVGAWPTMFLLDKQGRIRWKHVGEGPYDETERLIQKLLAEK